MFMSGFQSVFGGASNSGCLLFFVPGARLNAAWKFSLALIGVFLLGVASEGFSRLRRRHINRGSGIAVKLALYAINTTIGYLVMLAAMMYSIEVFVVTIGGLTVGHALFNVGDNTATVTRSACCHEDSTTEAQISLECDESHMRETKCDPACKSERCAV